MKKETRQALRDAGALVLAVAGGFAAAAFLILTLVTADYLGIPL